MKKILSLVLLFTLCLTLFGCSSKSAESTGNTVNAEIVVKGFGTISLELYRDKAPITVDHFVKLAKAGSYDGTSFTRMQSGFVLQGGDGCSDTSTIKGEFSSNGVTTNDISHEKGVISMARSSANDSASSQFFIMLSDYPSLDGSYAAFGKVTDGWDVVEKIVNSIDSSDYLDGYYGTSMGFLKESSYITIKTINIK